ncbi:MAG: glycyl-tRNA synthetase beta chain [Flavobacteriales bacterium]
MNSVSTNNASINDNAMTNDCLIELGTEELPPKNLKSLSEDFAKLVSQALNDAGLPAVSVEVYATPRRLGILMRDIPTQQADKIVEKRGPALQAAFDKEGNPSKAAQGFARGCGVEVTDLMQRETDKGTWLFFEKNETGLSLAQILPEVVATAINKLPIAKRMRWGDQTVEFVRPVKWLVMMVGSNVVEGEVLGVRSGNQSRGHRFHAPGHITFANAGDYVACLANEGKVVASFDKRKSMIREQIEQSAVNLGGVAHIEEALLNEVTGLVEFPVAVCGTFDAEFLSIPVEALVMTMQDNQKYFALFDQQGGLLPNFITISNIESKQPEMVAKGNERVIRPRFADARFFFDQDQKQPLSQRSEQLDKVVFQNKLGSVGDKSRRIAKLAVSIAKQIGADEAQVEKAAHLCKCDLMTEMVGEFPKLQGLMGRYYAEFDQEPKAVSDAIEQHYWPKFSGDQLPSNDVAQCVALADRLDSLVGIFGIGQKPSGVKDPFALRRAALSVVRILIEKDLPLNLMQLIDKACEALADKFDAGSVGDEVSDYIFDRLRAYYQEQGIGFDIVDAVICTKPAVLSDCDRRVQAVNQFQSNAAAIALAAANKRIANILKKQGINNVLDEGNPNESVAINETLFEAAAEKQLFQQLVGLQDKVDTLFAEGEYLQGLNELASLRPVVDQFFDDVMVMVDDQAIKTNRLALLGRLLNCFRQVADFSRIQS